MTQKFPVYFNRFTLELTQDQAESGAHPGQCDADIAALLELPEIAAQLDALSPEDIAAELRPWGGWDDTELQDHDANRARLLWIACGQLNEGAPPEDDAPEDDAPEDDAPETVTLIASGYEFICPACETYNHVIETSETVTCGECWKTFVVDEAIHAHG